MPDPSIDASNEQFEEIAVLAQRQVAAQREVERLSDMLKDATQRLRRIQEHDLPDAMQAAGLDQVTTIDGAKVSVTEKLYARIPKKNKAACAAWLVDHGLASLVREDVTVPFDRGDHDRVKELQEFLCEGGFDQFYIDEAINTGSVKSAIVELLEAGQDVPLDLFGAHFLRRAEIK